jgi:histidine triad (HIT) family protein
MNTEKTIFQKIIDSEIPCYKIYEDDICIAILDKFPNTKGQSLIIPKTPIDYAFDLEDEIYNHCFSVAKKIVKAIDKTLEPKRTCLVVEGFDVPHAHIKLFPVYELKLTTESGSELMDNEADKILEEIRAEL